MATEDNGRKEKIQRMYDSVARFYDIWRSRLHPANLRKMVQMLALEPADEILDVGTGPGIIPLKFRKLGVRNPTHGLDLSPRQIEIARRKAAAIGQDHLSFCVGDMEALPISDAAFSCITCVEALLLAQDKLAVLAEFHRVLKPGGKVLVVEPKADGLDKRVFYLGFNAFLKAWALFRPEIRGLCDQDFRGKEYFCRDSLAATVGASPLRLERLEEDKTHFYCLCRKPA